MTSSKFDFEPLRYSLEGLRPRETISHTLSSFSSIEETSNTNDEFGWYFTVDFHLPTILHKFYHPVNIYK